ncbi:MAG TPA: histidine phosphatase family protein [Chthoniobacterales bacterium]|nr:histidine phosphatase family protein [Chthoniobacterales bacterium]
MANFLFIRHGAHDYLGRAIAGSRPGVHLNELGRGQAEHLVEKLSRLSIDAIYSGPLERVRETAEPLCRARNLPLQVADEFTEIGLGEWTDRTFTALAAEQLWGQYNSFRSSTTAPQGELMLEVQARVVRKLTELRRHHQVIVIVTHGDVIRTAFAHFLGVHLDLFHRIEIDPASLSVLELGENFVHIRLLNAPSTGSPLELPTVRHQ